MAQKACAQNLILAQNSKSDYVILIPALASANEKLAASELQKYLKQISGAELVITNDQSKKNKIIIGNNEYLKQIDPTINFKELDEDGFLIKQIGNTLIFAGGTNRGVLYGVYTFLETYLNCKMYAPDALVIPKRSTIVINGIYNKQIPKVKYRETYYWPSNDSLYTNWHKLDHYIGNNSLWGNWVHSFLRLIPPDQYFKAHPEYFALRDGKRGATQLCLSNPDVYKLVVNSLKQSIVRNPNAKYWSVSQADNAGYCECDLCKAIDDREGSPSGSILTFVNKVAANFPDKIINTLAYSYSVKPPKVIKPSENVLITFCTSGNLDRGIGYSLNPTNNAFLSNLNRWGQISKRFMVWDYVVDFKDFTMPFPNIAAISLNIKDFVKNNANALFIQGNYYGGGEFAELKTYLISKLMWDSTMDPNGIIKEFLYGYYGKGAPFIQSYITTLNLAYQKSKRPLGIFDTTDDHLNDYLSDNNLNSYLVLLKSAEQAVASNPVLLKRVKRITASVTYASINNGIYASISRGKISKNAKANSLYITKLKQQLENVYSALEEQKVTRMTEPGTAPADYRGNTLSILDSAKNIFVPDNLALNKKIILTYSPSAIHAKYAGNNALIDGIKGNIRSGLNTWQAFYGGKFEAIIDLYKATAVSGISTQFLKTPRVRVVYPDVIKFYWSNDGINYTEVDKIRTEIVDSDGKSEIQSYSTVTKPLFCRYIKISASNKRNDPMLIDEIVVRK